MNEYYNDDLAQYYDKMYPDLGTSAAVAQYMKLNGNGRKILEFGVGTGRLALPLSANGFEVWGIDNSNSMINVLKAKDLADEVTLIEADFYETGFINSLSGQQFDIVMIACNTIYSTQEQDRQMQVFQNAAKVLSDNGILVVESFCPTWVLNQGRSFSKMRKLDEDSKLLEYYEVDDLNQLVFVEGLILRQQAPLIPFEHVIRYIEPSEMDIMAKSAGFIVEAEARDWGGNPLIPGAQVRVARYRKVP